MLFPILKVKYKKGKYTIIKEVGRSEHDAIYIDKNGGLQYIDLFTKEGTEKIGDKEPKYTFVSDGINIPGGMKFIEFGDFEDISLMEQEDQAFKEEGKKFTVTDPDELLWEGKS